MKKNLRNILLYIVVPIIFIVTIVAVSLSTKNVDKVKYYEIVEMVKTNQISAYQLNLYSGELVYVKRADGKEYRYTIADPNIFYNDVNDFVFDANSLSLSADFRRFVSPENRQERRKHRIFGRCGTLIPL